LAAGGYSGRSEQAHLSGLTPGAISVEYLIEALYDADMISVEVEDRPKHWQRIQANLEDISPSGACFEVDKPIPADASVRLICRDYRVIGTVRHCTFRETGYSVGVGPGFEPSW
jgi:hypothetical protein